MEIDSESYFQVKINNKIKHEYYGRVDIQSEYYKGLEKSSNFALPVIQNQAINDQKEKRNVQTCSLCQNHKKLKFKKGHNDCDYEKEEHLKNCPECVQTIKRRKLAAKDKKNNYKLKKSNIIAIEKNKLPGKQRNEQKCRKCANHGLVRSMKEHKKNCEFFSCNCTICNETVKRRDAVKIEAQTKRKMIKKSSNDGYSSSSSSSYPESPNTSESCVLSPVKQLKLQCYKPKENMELKSFSFAKSPNYSECSPFSSACSDFSDSLDHYGKNDNQFMDMNTINDSSEHVYLTNEGQSNTFSNAVIFYENSGISNTLNQSCHAYNEYDVFSIMQGLLNDEFNLEKVLL